MNTPIADIIALADTINDLSLRISQGLDNTSKFYHPDDAIVAYTEMREKMTAVYDIYLAKELHLFALVTRKNWEENEEAKKLTPADLGCDYPI